MGAVALDIFCGRGGWTKALMAEGFEVLGVDLVRHPEYPSPHFLQVDVRDFRADKFHGVDVVVASPPCTGFTTANPRPAFQVDRPNAADFELVLHAIRVIREADPTWWAIENVRGARKWFSPFLGEPSAKIGPWYLWGKFPSFLVEQQNLPLKTRHRDPALRSEVPLAWARPLAKAMREAL